MFESNDKKLMTASLDCVGASRRTGPGQRPVLPQNQFVGRDPPSLSFGAAGKSASLPRQFDRDD